MTMKQYRDICAILQVVEIYLRGCSEGMPLGSRPQTNTWYMRRNIKYCAPHLYVGWVVFAFFGVRGCQFILRNWSGDNKAVRDGSGTGGGGRWPPAWQMRGGHRQRSEWRAFSNPSSTGSLYFRASHTSRREETSIRRGTHTRKHCSHFDRRWYASRQTRGYSVLASNPLHSFSLVIRRHSRKYRHR